MAAQPTRGRRPEHEQAALRERIEQLMLQGLPATAIHRALTGPESPNPIVLSARQVRAHMRAIERAWAARSGPETLEQDRAKAAARLEDVMRTALGRSTLNARSNIGVGYLNAYLKAQEQWIRLRGLDAPARTELSGSRRHAGRVERQPRRPPGRAPRAPRGGAPPAPDGGRPRGRGRRGRGTGVTSTYRRILRERAATDDAAFAEYVSDLVFPAHLREASRFADRHPRAIRPRPARPRQDDRSSSIAPPA